MSRSSHFTERHEDVTVSMQAFRDGMSRLGAAVNIITSDGPIGRPSFTPTAVCSISDAPPSPLVCMNRRSLQNEPLKQNGVFCVNTLSAGQQELSGVCFGVGMLEMGDDCGIAHALGVNTIR